MRWTVFSLAGLVMAAQMVITVAAAARGATALVQRRDLVLGGLVVFGGIVARGRIGHIVRAVGFLVHEAISFKDG